MCGRYLTKERRALERELQYLDVQDWPDFAASYNVAPSQMVPVVRHCSSGNVCELMRFGLVPFFAHGEPPRYSTINARVENLATGACWRGPWKRGQRCLVLASGFYEWHVLPDGRRKQPYLVHPADQPSFAMAGLWDRSSAPDGPAIHSFAIVTLPASPLMAQIHNARRREPALLAREDCLAWLTGAPGQASEILRPYPDELLSAYPVSSRVNSPSNNDLGLTRPLTQVTGGLGSGESA